MKSTAWERAGALTASEIVAAVAAGTTTCEDVAQACLDRIAEREPHVQAWEHVDPEHVLAQARSLDRAPRRGPLHGVPVGFKDIIDTHDLPTGYGTAVYKGHQPARDAACVALSRRAGSVVMGKTVTTEFANVTPGKTRNPLDTERTPGGSSSGSAAAVADNMVPLAVGTQTTGSTTRPASFCGVFGFRPTHGDLTTSGVMEVSRSLDTLGILARSIDDVALFKDVLAGVEPEPLTPPAGPPRVGFCRPYFWSELEPETRHLLKAAADRLATAGAVVEEIVLPAEFEGLAAAHRDISGFEMARNLAGELERHGDDLSQGLREGRLQDGWACSHDRYTEQLDLAVRCRRLLPAVGTFDVLLTPAAAGEAPVGWAPVPHPWVYMMWTVLHVPSISLPVFSGPSGLPIGAQLVALWRRDRDLLTAAQWIWEVLQ